MDVRTFLIVFGTVFLAELGDKTQLATLLYASGRASAAWGVFIAASLALVASTALAVLAGGLLGKTLQPRHLHIVAGVGFIAIGIWTLARA